jgi:hypothetical protein
MEGGALVKVEETTSAGCVLGSGVKMVALEVGVTA